MATYAELYGLGLNNDPLLQRVAVALTIKAQALVSTTPTQAQINWAIGVFGNPLGHAQGALTAVLAANKSATVAVINAVTDAQLQTAVDAVVDKIFANTGA